MKFEPVLRSYSEETKTLNSCRENLEKYLFWPISEFQGKDSERTLLNFEKRILAKIKKNIKEKLF